MASYCEIFSRLFAYFCGIRSRNRGWALWSRNPWCVCDPEALLHQHTDRRTASPASVKSPGTCRCPNPRMRYRFPLLGHHLILQPCPQTLFAHFDSLGRGGSSPAAFPSHPTPPPSTRGHLPGQSDSPSQLDPTFIPTSVPPAMTAFPKLQIHVLGNVLLGLSPPVQGCSHYSSTHLFAWNQS